MGNRSNSAAKPAPLGRAAVTGYCRTAFLLLFQSLQGEKKYPPSLPPWHCWDLGLAPRRCQRRQVGPRRALPRGAGGRTGSPGHRRARGEQPRRRSAPCAPGVVLDEASAWSPPEHPVAPSSQPAAGSPGGCDDKSLSTSAGFVSRCRGLRCTCARQQECRGFAQRMAVTSWVPTSPTPAHPTLCTLGSSQPSAPSGTRHPQ